MIRPIKKVPFFSNLIHKVSKIFQRKYFPFIFLVVMLIVILVTFALVKVQQDIRQRAATTGLMVDATKTINPFSNQMLGQAMVNWEHSWGKPYVNNVPGLAQAFKASKVGVIRYAGGLWANSVGFDPSKTQITPYTAWTYNGNTYYFSYGTDEITNVQEFAKNIGAEVMVQVNVSNNDPDMWAAMVKYTNGYNASTHTYSKYPIKYWEFGNELDYDPDHKLSASEYSSRITTYMQKMRAEDPNIQFMGGAQAFAVPQVGGNTTLSEYFFLPPQAAQNSGINMESLTYHWYQTCNASSYLDLLRFRFYDDLGNPIDPKVWNNSYSRYWADYIPTAVDSGPIASYPYLRQGITEISADACNYDNSLNGNHMGALWFSDVLGRLAYHGLDFATTYEGFGSQGYAMLYPDNVNSPTKIFARPAFYAHLMYAKYFGNQMVESASYKNDDISIWASTDTTDPGKLKLRITNFTASPITTPVTLNGYVAGTGQVYQLTSTNPTDMSANSMTSQAPTTINNVKIDAMNVDGSVQSIQPLTININGSSFTYTFPAYSSTAIILSPGTTFTPTPTPNPVATIVPTGTNPTATPTPQNTPTPNPSLTPTPTRTPTPTATPTRTPTPTPTSALPTPTPTMVISNKGLKGYYYNDSNLSNLVIQRIDPLINFNWGTGSPDALLPNDGFSVRWTGILQSPVTDDYTIFTRSDDGVRLWIDGNLVINNWTMHSLTENKARVRLSQGNHTIQMDYFEQSGSSQIQLLWKSRRLQKQVIKSDYFLTQ